MLSNLIFNYTYSFIDSVNIRKWLVCCILLKSFLKWRQLSSVSVVSLPRDLVQILEFQLRILENANCLEFMGHVKYFMYSNNYTAGGPRKSCRICCTYYMLSGNMVVLYDNAKKVARVFKIYLEWLLLPYI